MIPEAAQVADLVQDCQGIDGPESGYRRQQLMVIRNTIARVAFGFLN